MCIARKTMVVDQPYIAFTLYSDVQPIRKDVQFYLNELIRGAMSAALDETSCELIAN